MTEEQRLRENWRGRRLQACRAADELHAIIEKIGYEDGSTLPPDRPVPLTPSGMLKREVQNQLAVLLRTILILNDGDISQQTLQRF